MEKMKYLKAQLLEEITKNRENHLKIFEEAQEGYRKRAIEVLEQSLKDAKEGRRIQMSFQLIAPVNQTKEYDRVIRQLQMTTNEEIELDEHDFAQYVMDEWNWSRQFFASNAGYSAMAAETMSSKGY